MKEHQKINEHGPDGPPAGKASFRFDGKTLVLSAPAYVVKDEVGRTERRLDE